MPNPSAHKRRFRARARSWNAARRSHQADLPDCSLRRYRERYRLSDAVCAIVRQGVDRPAATAAIAYLFGVEYCAVALAPDRQ